MTDSEMRTDRVNDSMTREIKKGRNRKLKHMAWKQTICNATMRSSKEKTEAGGSQQLQPWLKRGLQQQHRSNKEPPGARCCAVGHCYDLEMRKHNPAQGCDKEGQEDPHPGLEVSTPYSKKKTLAHPAPWGSREMGTTTVSKCMEWYGREREKENGLCPVDRKYLKRRWKSLGWCM